MHILNVVWREMLELENIYFSSTNNCYYCLLPLAMSTSMMKSPFGRTSIGMHIGVGDTWYCCFCDSITGTVWSSLIQKRDKCNFSNCMYRVVDSFCPLVRGPEESITLPTLGTLLREIDYNSYK